MIRNPPIGREENGVREMGNSRYKPALIAGLAMLLAACGGGGGSSDDSGGNSGPPANASCNHFTAQRQPFFGDLHVHTIYSLDANTQGTIITPHQAYQFAMGERLGIQPYDAQGNPTRFTQLARRLDFAAVTDHAELFGETEICTNPVYLEYNAPECIFYRERPNEAFIFFNLVAVGLPELPQFPVPPGVPVISDAPVIGSNGSVPRLPYCGLNGERCLEAAKTPWQDTQRAAEAFYDRSSTCRFTTFVGYEYTLAPQSNNLHRNVIFRSEVVPEMPPASQEFPRPELLWAELARVCRAEDGCDYLTIPHNSNLSAGLMFETQDRFNNDYTAEFAQTRQDNEPLIEIVQHKGQSECLGPSRMGGAEELCDFELLPYNNLTGDRFMGFNTGPPLPQDFVREAMKEGLRQQQTIGVNPFKYGFIGSSDTHIASPGNTMETATFPGHGGASGSSAVQGLTDVIEASPGGLAVLWAEENTRESLFDAMRRREAYATSGTRPIVRFFGGWNLAPGQCASANFAADGYANGVPMGGNLPARPAGAGAPRFAVSALRDAGASAADPAQPLDRIQIIKGWVDASGAKQEKVYDVAVASGNTPSVNLNNCAVSGNGAASLCTVWTDPDFDPAEHAFYYARVVENPQCRWHWRQCLAGGVTPAQCASDPESEPEGFERCCDTEYPKTLQERAWTSPIWYQPPAS